MRAFVTGGGRGIGAGIARALAGDGWDVIETANGPSPSYTVLNDWMTFLSRGWVKTGTGVSDTHNTWSTVGASTNIIEASWRALVDSVEYGLVVAA